MATFKDRLIEALEVRGLRPSELAKLTGISEGAISQYRKGEYKATQRNLDKLAKALNVSIPWLMGEDVPMERTPILDIFSIPGVMPMPKMKKMPLIGTIACGEPVLAVENYDEIIEVPEDIRCDFAVRCKGDSMINARILDGDIVFITIQPTVESGEIASVLIGDEVTLKRVIKRDDRVILMPENPMMNSITYIGSEAAGLRILGKAVEFKSKVR